MREVKQYKDIERFMLASKPIIQESNSASFVDDDLSLKLIVEGEFYYSKTLNNTLYFQIGSESNLSVKSGDVIKCKNGLWGLITAFPISSDKFYIFHQESNQAPKFLILDEKLDIVMETAKGCNYGINNYLFRCFGNKIICFDVQSKEAVWENEARANH